jgi:hypothetical protein
MGQTVISFRHKAGDGVHYVLNKPFKTPQGEILAGTPSYTCILSNLECVTLRHADVFVRDLWNQTYPNDPMSSTDSSIIFHTCLPYVDNFNPASAEDIEMVLADVEHMGCPELATAARRLLVEKGVFH